jgi:hypothetical protein
MKSMPNRDPLLKAIQKYAESWKAGKETFGSHPATTELYIELDKYEYAVAEETKNRIYKPEQEHRSARFNVIEEEPTKERLAEIRQQMKDAPYVDLDAHMGGKKEQERGKRWLEQERLKREGRDAKLTNYRL